MVQYLVLAHAHSHPELTGNIGNLALLKLLAEIGLIDSKKASAVADAYRLYRRLQHGIRLQGETRARVSRKEVGSHVKAVLDLWQLLFQPGPT
jgi:glutamate-ammonia-ligase adenylyltransferase